jgi:chemotaxis protein MotB
VSSGGHGRRCRRRHEEEEHENHERWLVSYADMLTLLFCLFVVLYAMSQVDKAKFAALASGLSHSFGTPVSANDSSTGSQASVLTGLPNAVDIAAGVGETTNSQGLSKQQVDAAAAQAALQRAQNVEAEARKAYDQLAAARAQIDQALVRSGYKGAATYQIDQRGLVVHVVADNVLFDSAQATLRPQGAKLLDAVAPTIQGLPNQVRVEGHANIEPVAPRGPWPSNWELSAYRATTVLRHLTGDGVPEPRLSAAGYGSTQPLVPYTDPQAMNLNRRVDIVVLSTASPEANDQLAGMDAGSSQKGPR